MYTHTADDLIGDNLTNSLLYPHTHAIDII